MTLTYRLSPLMAPFLQRIIGPGTPDMEVLQPAETVTVRPPAALEGMVDRFVQSNEYSDIEEWIRVSRATTVTHTPLVRYVRRKALVRRTGFATARNHQRYGHGFGIADLVGPIERSAVLRYCHGWASYHFFGHWLSDSIPSAWIEPDAGALWMPHNADWSHAADYLDLFELRPIPDRPVLADVLITYHDLGQGSHKAARYARICGIIQDRFGGGVTAPVYLRRGKTGAARLIANEDALVENLLARNWRVVDIAGASVETLQRALCPASVVVSIDGSHLDHAHMALSPGSVMVLLVPQDRVTLHHVGLARCHGVKPGFVVLKGSVDAGYIADLDEILRTVDLADAL